MPTMFRSQKTYTTKRTCSGLKKLARLKRRNKQATIARWIRDGYLAVNRAE